MSMLGSIFRPLTLAYQSRSNSPGKSEIYVRAFSGVGDQVPVSNKGGTQAVWSPNGHDLLCQSGDQIMGVSYTEKGDRFAAEKLWSAKTPFCRQFAVT